MNSGKMQQDANGSERPNRLPSMSNIYQPLDSSRLEIRLLYVEGRQNAEVGLTCTLETVSLLDDPKPTYEAISYCWAEVSSTATIELNGTPVDVPGSAAKVLRQFRLQSGSRILWIDAVCINQEDLNERSQQVALMGQIYRASQGTLVWLGDSNGATERTLRTLNRISDEFYNPIYGSMPGINDDQEGTELSEKSDKELEDDDIQPAIDFYKRPWFSRVWVIQEVVLAKTSTCYCGPHTIPWNVVCRSTRWLGDFLFRVKRGQEFETMRGMHLASLGLALQNRPTLPLAVILRAVQPLSCSNARDKFYGIYSLTMLPSLGQKFQDDYGVNIDYTKSISAVFRDVTRVSILQYCNLEILKAIDDNSDSSRANDWPTWVPRWDLDRGCIDLGGQSTSAHGIPFGLGPVLSGDRKVDRNLALAYAAAKGMQDCLPLRGYALDSVVTQISTFNVADDAEGLQVQDLAKFMSECFKFINTPTRIHLARKVVTTLLSISHLDHVSPGTNERCFQLLDLSASIFTVT